MFSCPVSAGPSSGGRDSWAFIGPKSFTAAGLLQATCLAVSPTLAMAGMALAASIATMSNATVRTKAMRLNASSLLPLGLLFGQLTS
jgi:hypothetical protein